MIYIGITIFSWLWVLLLLLIIRTGLKPTVQPSKQNLESNPADILADYQPVNKYEAEIIEIVKTEECSLDILDRIEDELGRIENEIDKRQMPYGGGFATSFRGIKKIQYFKGVPGKELNDRWLVYKDYANKLNSAMFGV